MWKASWTRILSFYRNQTVHIFKMLCFLTSQTVPNPWSLSHQTNYFLVLLRGMEWSILYGFIPHSFFLIFLDHHLGEFCHGQNKESLISWWLEVSQERREEVQRCPLSFPSTAALSWCGASFVQQWALMPIPAELTIHEMETQLIISQRQKLEGNLINPTPRKRFVSNWLTPHPSSVY